MKKYIYLTFRIVIALILLQTLAYKFTAHPESVALFSQLGMEPQGRIGIGIIELIASILLLWNKPVIISMGAVLSLGLMSGALFFHFTQLGIAVNGSYVLFILGSIAFLLSLLVTLKYKKHIPIIGNML